MKLLPIGLLDQKITQDGIEDYFFPVNQEHIFLTKNKLLKEFASLFRHGKQEKDIICPVFSILGPTIIFEIMLIYKALLTIQSYIKYDYQIDTPNNYRIIPALLNHTAPTMPGVTNSFNKGPDYPHPLKAPFYRYYLSIQHNRFSHSLLFREIEKQPYTINWIPLINMYAHKYPKPVQYSFVSDWYQQLPDSIPQKEHFNTNEIDYTQELLRKTQTIFLETGIELPDYLKNYLLQWIEKLFTKSAWWYQQLDHSNQSIPKELWTGSGGKYWTRLLRHIVRRKGGKVIGFDHGRYGVGLANHHTEDLVEFDSCDEFISVGCGLPPKNLADHSLIMNSLPNIIHLDEPPEKKSIQAKLKNLKSSTHIKTILIPTALYFEESYDGDFYMQGLPVLDWHCRLFAKLQHWNYTLFHKPHPPEGYCVLPLNFSENVFGIQVITKPFEETMEYADLILFDYSHTSILIPMLYSNKPLVYIDFYNNFRPEFYAMVNKRCRIVNGWLDENNRAQVDWKELENAIPESMELIGNFK